MEELNKSRTYLAGIVAWGAGCANPDLYGVYTDVSYFFDWIKDTAEIILARPGEQQEPLVEPKPPKPNNAKMFKSNADFGSYLVFITLLYFKTD